MMKSKHLKLIMELIFIFIIPLGILLINCNYQNTIEYDNNGNYQSTEKHIEFTSPFSYTDGYKNVIYDFNIWNEEYKNGVYDEGNNGIFIPFASAFACDDYIEVQGNSTYYFNFPQYYFYVLWYDVNYDLLRYDYFLGNNSITCPSNTKYMTFYNSSTYGTTYKNDICINISVSWANGNYVPFGQPLIVYTQTDVSGQNDINYTIWGQLKNLIVENLQLQDNVIIDIIISYTILWFTMFVIWHFFYWVFDGIVHLFIDWVDKGKKSD